MTFPIPPSSPSAPSPAPASRCSATPHLHLPHPPPAGLPRGAGHLDRGALRRLPHGFKDPGVLRRGGWEGGGGHASFGGYAIFFCLFLSCRRHAPLTSEWTPKIREYCAEVGGKGEGACPSFSNLFLFSLFQEYFTEVGGKGGRRAVSSFFSLSCLSCSSVPWPGVWCQAGG